MMEYAKLGDHLAEVEARLDMVALGTHLERNVGDLCIALSQLTEVVRALLDEHERSEIERVTVAQEARR